MKKGADDNLPKSVVAFSDQEFQKIIDEIFSTRNNIEALISKLCQSDLSKKYRLEYKTEMGSGSLLRNAALAIIERSLKEQRYDIISQMCLQGADTSEFLKQGIVAASDDGNFPLNADRYVKLVEVILEHSEPAASFSEPDNVGFLRRDLYTYLTQSGRPDILHLFSKYIDFPNISLEQVMQEETQVEVLNYWDNLLEMLNFYQDRELPSNLANHIEKLCNLIIANIKKQSEEDPHALSYYSRNSFNTHPTLVWLEHLSKNAPSEVVREVSQKLCDTLSPAKDNDFHTKAYNAKLLAGHLNLDGTITLESGNQGVKPYTVVLHGLDPYWTLPSIRDSFETFKKEVRESEEYIDVFNEVSQSLDEMANIAENTYSRNTAQKILENCKKGLVSVIPSGSRAHSANYALSYLPEENCYVLSKLNRGAGTGGYNSGIVNYKITKPENLTEALIQKMLTYHAVPPKEFCDFYEKELDDILGLQFISKQSASRQSANSCTTVSGDMALRSILTQAFRRHFAKKGEKPENAQKLAEEQSYLWFKRWSPFDKNHFFDRYLNDPDNKPLSYELLKMELFRHHDPNKIDEVYRGRMIIPLLLAHDKEKLTNDIINLLIEYQGKYENKNFNDLKEFLKKIDPELAKNCIEAAEEKAQKQFEEQFDRIATGLKELPEKEKRDPYFLKYLGSDIRYLLEKDDLYKTMDFFKERDGTTLMQIAEQTGHQKVIELFSKALSEVMTLRLKEYLIVATADSGFKVFHSDLNCLGTLLAHGADIKQFYNELLENAEPKIIQFLLDKKYVNINDPDKDGKTLLMHACANNNLEAALLLIRNGADISLTDSKGKNYKDYIKNGKKSTLRERQMISEIKKGMSTSKRKGILSSFETQKDKEKETVKDKKMETEKVSKEDKPGARKKFGKGAGS